MITLPRRILRSETHDLPLLGYLPADLKVQEADRLGIPVYNHVPELKKSAEIMVKRMTPEAGEKNNASTGV